MTAVQVYQRMFYIQTKMSTTSSAIDCFGEIYKYAKFYMGLERSD